MRETNKPLCGECSFFKHEDIDGYGICNADDMKKRCSDKCNVCNSLKSIERILDYFQKWRRGDNIKMPHPYVVGIAIDWAIKAIRGMKKESRYRFAIKTLLESVNSGEKIDSDIQKIINDNFFDML